MKPGERVFGAGDEVTPARVGVMAALGVGEVLAHPRPRVGVISTGDEFVTGPQSLRPGQIRDSNRPTLLALVARAGGQPVDLGHVPDDEVATEAAIERGATSCDAVLSSGGVSMGDIDLVRVVLDRIGDMRWMQVAIRPAKPLAFGRVPGPAGRPVPVFGLPGNPVSSMVSFALFARPGLRRLAGHPDDRLHLPRWGRRSRAAAAPPGRQDALRARDGRASTAAGRCAVVVGGPGVAPARVDGPRRRPGRSTRRRRCGCGRDGPRHPPCRAGDRAGPARDCVAWPHGRGSRRHLRARIATFASRSPTAATSAAPTACRPKAWTGCPGPRC